MVFSRWCSLLCTSLPVVLAFPPINPPVKSRATSSLDQVLPFTRRKLLSWSTAAACAATVQPIVATDAIVPQEDRRYGPVPGGPFDFPSAQRATVRREIVPGRIWVFDQVQGLIYVHVPVRMTVVKLDSGGLFVYAPVAPTTECLQLLSEVEKLHGPVRHILLPSVALEHKVFAGAFASARPAAQLWVSSAQYTLPVELPISAQGFPSGTRVLPEGDRPGDAPPEWAEQLPYRILGPLVEKSGKFQEVVCFDETTQTLLVTDLVVSIPSEPPAIIRENDKRALLYHSRDSPTDVPLDTVEALSIGWKKICLFALYFQSSPLIVASQPDGTLAGALRFYRAAFPEGVPDEARALGWRGFFAWSWRQDWPQAFDRLQFGGKPLVPPILQVAVLNREPARVVTFVERVARDFAFKRIIPCHFEPIQGVGPQEWSEAFDFLRKQPVGGMNARKALPEADVAFLREFEQQLIQLGSVRPAGPLA